MPYTCQGSFSENDSVKERKASSLKVSVAARLVNFGVIVMVVAGMMPFVTMPVGYLDAGQFIVGHMELNSVQNSEHCCAPTP